MSGLIPTSQSERRLRLVHGDELAARERPAVTDGAKSAAPVEGRVKDAHVLIVGDDAARRSKMLSELRGLLPLGTPFVEAGETWEVLAHTTGSRMVVLTGGLGDVSSHSLMRILSRRHPTLPVIAVGNRTRSAQPQHAGVALV